MSKPTRLHVRYGFVGVTIGDLRIGSIPSFRMECAESRADAFSGSDLATWERISADGKSASTTTVA